MRKARKILAVHVETGQSQIFPSIQTVCDYIYHSNLAGEKATASSVQSYITRISKKGGEVYGFRFHRAPEDIREDEMENWVDSIQTLSKIKALASNVLLDEDQNTLRSEDTVIILREALEFMEEVLPKKVTVEADVEAEGEDQ